MNCMSHKLFPLPITWERKQYISIILRHICLSKGLPIMSLLEQSGLKPIIPSEYSKTYYSLRWVRNSAWIPFTFSSCTSSTCTKSSKLQHFWLSQILEALWHTLRTNPSPRKPYSLPSGKRNIYLSLLLDLSHDLLLKTEVLRPNPVDLRAVKVTNMCQFVSTEEYTKDMIYKR